MYMQCAYSIVLRQYESIFQEQVVFIVSSFRVFLVAMCLEKPLCMASSSLFMYDIAMKLLQFFPQLLLISQNLFISSCCVWESNGNIAGKFTSFSVASTREWISTDAHYQLGIGIFAVLQFQSCYSHFELCFMVWHIIRKAIWTQI